MMVEAEKATGCVVCGEMDLEVLDFHHVNPEEKEFSIRNGTAHVSLERLLAEMEKCVVVCANDHRRIHAGTIEIHQSSKSTEVLKK